MIRNIELGTLMHAARATDDATSRCRAGVSQPQPQPARRRGAAAVLAARYHGAADHRVQGQRHQQSSGVTHSACPVSLATQLLRHQIISTACAQGEPCSCLPIPACLPATTAWHYFIPVSKKKAQPLNVIQRHAADTEVQGVDAQTWHQLMSAISTADSQVAADMAEAALWLYGMGLEELQRQVSSECRQRGELLAACWCAPLPHQFPRPQACCLFCVYPAFATGLRALGMGATLFVK